MLQQVSSFNYLGLISRLIMIVDSKLAKFNNIWRPSTRHSGIKFKEKHV